MCMKYEDEYGPCFDEMEGWSNDEKSLPFFLGKFNVKVNDKSKLVRMFEDLLNKCHEEKIIQPMTKEEIEIEKERKIKEEIQQAVLVSEIFYPEKYNQELERINNLKSQYVNNNENK